MKWQLINQAINKYFCPLTTAVFFSHDPGFNWWVGLEAAADPCGIRGSWKNFPSSWSWGVLGAPLGSLNAELLKVERIGRVPTPSETSPVSHTKLTLMLCRALSNLGQSFFFNHISLFNWKAPGNRYEWVKPHKNPKAALGEDKDQILSIPISRKRTNKTFALETEIINTAFVPMGFRSKTRMNTRTCPNQGKHH